MNATVALLRNEARLLARTPGGMIPVLLPMLAALVIAAIPAARRPVDVMGGLSVSAAYTPTLILFAVTMSALVVLPQMLGSYRELGFLRRLRTTPTSPAALLGAYVIVTAILSLVVAVVIAVGPLMFGAPAIERPFGFAVAVVVALLPFLALGLMLCAVIPNPKAAAGIGNVVAAVMWFVAGMWFPRAQFPDWLLTVSDILPGGAATSLMTDAMVGAPISWQAVAVCLAWTVLGALIAVRTFRWE
ncbi:MAG TPA: ABC transporter permease [Propionibacterium sp.]|nr:ABC transporter permease [Propionibacterium sp.]